MTKEEKQKAINSLKISVPVMAMTQEEFNDYIQTLNKVMDWLEQEPCEDAISKSDVFEILGNLISIPYDFDRPINEKDVSESMDEIVALPSVTPTRPKGH